MRAIFSLFVWLYYCVLFLVFFILIATVWVFTFPFDKYRKVPNKVLSWLAWFLLQASPSWKVSILGEENMTLKFLRYSSPIIKVFRYGISLSTTLANEMGIQRSLALIPVMGWLVWLTGHLTINRKSKSAIKRLGNLVQPLRDNVPVMIFPEGTRSLDGELKRFKNGAFLLAMEYGFRLQPMVIDGGYYAMKSGAKVLNPKVNFTVSVLDPIETKNFEDLNTLKDHAYQLIDEELQRIRTS